MKDNFSRFLKAINLVIVTSLMLSFTFQGNGVTGAQAKSFGTGQGGYQGSPFRTKTKDSFVRLTNLVNASTGNSSGAADSSYLKKLDSHLQDMVSARLSGGNVIAAARVNGLRLSEAQAVLMDVYVNGSLDQATSQLEALGMQVLATNDSMGNVVEGYLPVESVLPAASLDFTRSFMPVMGFGVDTGSVTSQGDGAHNGPAARALGPTGAGVPVGIISDSMNVTSTSITSSQATGDLPASVIVLSDDKIYGTDEGRAMGEIIYDTAPGITSMYFASGTATGPVGKAASINALVAHGVKIIADDTFYLNEPFFQDGQVAQAVDNAYDSGVAYFASAGNRAKQSYESNFQNDGYDEHDFDPGPGWDWGQTVATIQPGDCYYAALQWDDPWGHATHDFDFILYDVGAFYPLAMSTSWNVTTGFPVEFVDWCNTSIYSVTVGHMIWKFEGDDTAHLKIIASAPFAEYNTSSQAIDPDAASARGAMAVAAVAWNEPGLNDPESYSSRGPSVTRLLSTTGQRLSSPDVRLKPNIAGADCVATSHNFWGAAFGDGSFCGTSAAAPSVAGIAALVLSAKPGMTPDQLYAIFENSAYTNDCASSPGNPDAGCGYGFLLANKAVLCALNCSTLTSTIGGVVRGTYQLLPSGSMRVNYAGLDSGPVIVQGSGAIPIIAAVRDAWVAGPPFNTTTSFAQLMGLPAGQVSDTYVFPAYNDVTLNEQLRIGNVDSVPTSVTVTIGGVLKGTYPLASNAAVRLNYAGLDSGPVVVKSTSGVHIIAAERDAWSTNGTSSGTTSFVQLMGLPASQLSDTYVFPAYNNVTLNEQLRIGNVDTVSSTVTVTIGGVLRGTYPLAANGSVRVNYAGLDSGPVIVKGTPGVHIIAAERDAWATYGVTTSYAQLMGLPGGQLSDTYEFPAYNNVTLNEQLRIANVDTIPTTVTVTIGGVLQGTYPLAANEAVRVNYAGLDSGPVVVQGTSGVHIIAAERDALTANGMTTSFVQLMGLPFGQLSDTYLFPAYNNVTLNEQLRFGVP